MMGECGFSTLFWEGLAGWRRSGQYVAFRRKMRDFLRARLGTGRPQGSDRQFHSGALAGLWHVQIRRNPDAVLVYELCGPRDVVLLALCTHADYGYAGKNLRGGELLMRRIEARRGERRDLPPWDVPPRWRVPEEAALHPDIPELSPPALRVLLSELEDEATGGRRLAALEPNPSERVRMDWMDRCLRAMDSVEKLAHSGLGGRHDLLFARSMPIPSEWAAGHRLAGEAVLALTPR